MQAGAGYLKYSVDGRWDRVNCVQPRPLSKWQLNKHWIEALRMHNCERNEQTGIKRRFIDKEYSLRDQKLPFPPQYPAMHAFIHAARSIGRLAGRSNDNRSPRASGLFFEIDPLWKPKSGRTRGASGRRLRDRA